MGSLSDLAERFRSAVEPSLKLLEGECSVKGEVVEVVRTRRGVRVTLADRSTTSPPDPRSIPWIEAWLVDDHPQLKVGHEVHLAGTARSRFQGGGRVRMVVSQARILNKTFRRSAYRRDQDRQLRAIGRVPRRELPWPIRTVIVLCGEGAAQTDFSDPLVQLGIQVKPIPIDTQDAAAMAEAIRKAGTERVDLLALVRGGGDAVDLLPFDEPVLARAIAESPIPVLVGVGHRKDRPRAGWFALDSAATPSAAASRIRARAKAFAAAECAARAKRHLDTLEATLRERSAAADRFALKCTEQQANLSRLGAALDGERRKRRLLVWLGTPAAALFVGLSAAGGWAARPYFSPMSHDAARAEAFPAPAAPTVSPPAKATRKPGRKRPAAVPPKEATAAQSSRGAAEPAPAQEPSP